MQWSKAKRRAEALFAPLLAGRVELRSTRYRRTHDAEGRGWLTIDGVEAWSFCTLRYYVEKNKLESGLRAANRAFDFRKQAERDDYYAAAEQAQAILERKGLVSKHFFESAVEDYPALSVAAALNSDNFVHRALAMLDRRLGHRRLATLALRTDEHPLVEGLYRFRCSVEHIRTPMEARSNKEMQLPSGRKQGRPPTRR